jgi:exodeoxyribonuclease V alpha subunit
MTVHKSQGSEFERVLMLLPADPSRLVTRELLYTGITRARSGFNLYATEYAISAAVGRRMQRVSGLSEKLWS